MQQIKPHSPDKIAPNHSLLTAMQKVLYSDPPRYIRLQAEAAADMFSIDTHREHLILKFESIFQAIMYDVSIIETQKTLARIQNRFNTEGGDTE